MPLSDSEKNTILQQNGYDPSDYQLDDSGNITDRVKESPAVSANPTLTKPADSPIETFAKSAAQAAPSSFGAGLGTAGGLTAASWLLGPEVGLPASILFGLGGGIASGAATGAIQKQIEPEAWQQNVAESQAENPISGSLGSLATLPLGGFNPNPSGAVRGLGTLGKMAVGMPRTAGEIGNLVNLGAGAALGAGSSVAQDLVSGNPITGKSLLENAGIGALFNKPNSIGRAIGFHDAQAPDLSDSIRAAATSGADLSSLGTAGQQVEPTPVGATIKPFESLQDAATQSGVPGMIKPQFTSRGKFVKDNYIPFKSAPESALHMDQLLRGNAPVEERGSDDFIKQIQYHKMQQEAAQQNLGETLRARAEVERQKAADMQTEAANQAMELQNSLNKNQVSPMPEARPAPLATTELGNDIMPDYTGVTEQNNKEAVAETPADLENQRIEERSQELRLDRTDFENEMMNRVKSANLPTKPTKNLFDLMQNWFQHNRGTSMQLDPNLPKLGETSVPTSNKQTLLGFLSHINPNKATIDTLFHEPFHVFYNRLKYSDRPSDVNLINKFEGLVKNLPEYQQKFGNDPHGVEEYITSNQGWEAVRRHILQDEGPLKSYWKDMMSYLKTRFSNSGSEADFRRILDYRFANDPVWTKYHGSSLSNYSPTGTREQGNRVNTLEEDIQRYRELDDRRNQMIADKTAFKADMSNFSDEFKNLWKELEDIKNRHGGMPPISKRSQEERREPGVPADHEDIAKYINMAIDRTKNDSLPVGDAEDLQKMLVDQVNWNRAPEVKKLLESKQFDYMDPTHWETVKKVLDNSLGKKVIVKEPAQPKQVEVPREVTGTELEANREQVKEPKAAKIPKQLPVPNKHNPLVIPEKPIKSPQQMERELYEAKTRWKEVESTDDPYQMMNTLADRYRKSNNPNRQTEINAMMHYLSSKYNIEIPSIRSQEKRLPSWAKYHDIVSVDRLNSYDKKFLQPDDKFVLATPTGEIYETQEHGFATGKTKQEVFEKLMQDAKYFDKNKGNSDIRSQEERKLPKEGEGKTPYPFTLKELNKGEDVQDKMFKDIQHLHGNDFDENNPSNLSTLEKDELEKLKRQVGEPGLLDLHEPDYNIRNQKERRSFVPFLTSRIDKIAERFKDNPVASYVSDQLHKFSGETDYLQGQISNKMIQATRDYPKESIEKVYHYLHEVDDTGKSSISLNPSEKNLSDKLVSILREPRNKQIALGLKVKSGKDSYRVAGIKPEGYMFNMIDPSVVNKWLEDPTSKESIQNDNAYLQHQIKHGLTPQEAQQRLSDYKGALGNNVSKDTDFGALRKAEGNGLPWDLVDKNFASAANRYGKRAARDLSFFKYIENDPKMREALNVRDQFGNRPDNPNPISSSKEVKDAMRSVYGLDTPQNPRIMAAARAVGNSVMGVGTAARNILNIPSFISNYVQSSQIPLAFKALSNINESKVRAFESNAVKSSFQDFDAAGFYEGNPDPVIRLMDKYSQFMRKYQGRDFSDKFEGQYFYSLGELLATDNIAKAKNGNAASIKWLGRFSDLVDGGSKKLISGDVSQDDISRVAKRFVDATRGTYGEEGLPGWAMEGTMAPFAALSRFSIEKSNTIMRDVVNPLQQGNIRPLIAYTLASLGVGYGTEKLNELLSNKRGNDATVAEALASQKPEQLIAKAIGLLQLSTYAGSVSDAAKLASDTIRGHPVSKQNTLSFPAYDFISNTIGSNLVDAIQAIRQGEDPFEVMGKFAEVASTGSIQSLRYLQNRLIEPEEAKRKERFRDLAVFNEMDKGQAPDSSGAGNEFLNLDVKKFKKTDDISEAVQELPDLVSQAIKKSTRSDGSLDPEKLKDKLAAIKENNYNTMPDPENMPLSFIHYLGFLRTTQGEQAANDRLLDYFKQRAVNEAKSEMVPTL